MLIKEAVRPVNALDQAITTFLRDSTRGLPEEVPAVLPPALALGLGRVSDNLDDPASLDALAGHLIETGMMASALAALVRAAGCCPPQMDLFCADVMDRLAGVESSLGMAWSAQADARVAARLRGAPDPDEDCPVLESAAFHVIDAWSLPEAYAALLEEHCPPCLRNDPLRDPFRAKVNYFAAMDSPIAGQKQDLSFFVCDETSTPVLQVECDVDGRRHLGCRETALRLVPVGPGPVPPEAEDLALRQAHLAAAWAGCPSVLLELDSLEQASAVQLDYLRRFSSGARSMAEAWIDLNREADEIVKDYRTNHRRGLRWGERTLAISRRDASDQAAISAYFDLYGQAGRLAPLAKASLIHQLEAGWLSLFLATWDGEPVSLLLTSHHGTTSYYSCGVSKPGLAAPLAHALMHRAILDAKAMGQSRFHFGDIYTESHGSDKMRSIAHFKIGFTGRVTPKLWFTLPTRST